MPDKTTDTIEETEVKAESPVDVDSTEAEKNAEEDETEDAAESVHAEEISQLAENTPSVDVSTWFTFRVGDTIKVHYRISEGSKTRIQPYQGLVIAMKGSSNTRTFTVRHIGQGGIGVERIFPVYGPNIVKVEIVKHGQTRQAKLYYLRGRVGKSALKVKDLKTKG